MMGTNSPRSNLGVEKQLLEIGVDPKSHDRIVTSGDVTRDMDRLRAFYADKIGKFPEKTGAGCGRRRQEETSSLILVQAIDRVEQRCHVARCFATPASR